MPKSILEDTERRQNILEKKRDVVDRYRPKLDDFVDTVPGGMREIEHDKQEVERLKQMFAQESEGNEQLIALREVSEIYEGVLIDQMEANAWFGEQCQMLSTSEYDDIKNGIDGIGVLKEEAKNSYLGFGIDVTFASEKEVLNKKLDSVRAVIRSGELACVKYFIDENGNRSSIRVPKVIVGSRLSSAEKLIEVWGSKRPDRNKLLRESPVQSKLIMETIWQLQYFYQYAMQHKNIDAARAYAELNNIFVDIYKEKEETIKQHWNEIQDDVVFQTMMEL